MSAILAVAMLLFTAIAVSSVFCDEEPSYDNFAKFSERMVLVAGLAYGGGDTPGFEDPK